MSAALTGSLCSPAPLWRPRLRPATVAILRRDGERRGERTADSPAASDRGSDLLWELVSDSGERVFRVALSVLGPGSEADAEDVAQEVFLRAHRALGDFRGDSSPSTWLYRTAYNLAVDHLRRRGRTGHGSDRREDEEVLERMPTGEPASDPHREALRSERERTVEALLETLPEAQRAALRLHYWMGHTVAEIAELLDAAPGTVKSHLHRGRERLRQRMTGGSGGAGREGAP